MASSSRTNTLLNTSSSNTDDEDCNLEPIQNVLEVQFIEYAGDSDISCSESDLIDSSVESSNANTDLDVTNNDREITNVVRTWTTATGTTLKTFVFQPDEVLPLPLQNQPPENLYGLFFDNELFENITLFTNLYAAIQLENNPDNTFCKTWKNTTVDELKNFLGLVKYMGYLVLPKISDYWKKDAIMNVSVCSKVMTRQRFQNLLKAVHFNDPHNENPNSKTKKLDFTVNVLNEMK